MPDFAYIARTTAGEKVTGVISAPSEREATTLLSGKALFPINVAQQKQRISIGGRRVSGQLVATTYSQLASLLRSGVPLLRSLKVLEKQTSNEALQEVLQNVHDRVEEGATLAEAMSRHPRVFGEMPVSMVRAGGEGGFLEEALDRVAMFTEEQEDLKSRTAGALAYPAFLAIVGTTVIAVLVIFFVPKFEELFESLRERGELPILTEWLLWTSHMLGGWPGLVAAVVLVAMFLLLRQYVQTEDGRMVSDRVKLRLPMIGPIFMNLAVARFCRVLGTLLRNGVPILKSLEIASSATSNRVLGQAIEAASLNISSGESLAAPLQTSGHFPATVIEMISVAEESNSLDTVLVDIADGLERRTSRRLDIFVRLLEPILLLFLAGAVLVVVIALLVPVLKMSMTL
jgi:type II secretory pathway component PulF